MREILLAIIALTISHAVMASGVRKCDSVMSATSLLSKLYVEKMGYAGQIGNTTYFAISKAWKDKAGIGLDDHLVDHKKFDEFVADGRGVLVFETKIDATQAQRLKDRIRELAKGAEKLPSAAAYLPKMGTYIGLINEFIAQIESSRRIALGEFAGRIFEGDLIGLHVRAFRNEDTKPVAIERWVHIHPYRDDKGQSNAEITELSKCVITIL